jgi:uncharacterized protein (TIGR02145 family)
LEQLATPAGSTETYDLPGPSPLDPAHYAGESWQRRKSANSVRRVFVKCGKRPLTECCSLWQETIVRAPGADGGPVDPNSAFVGFSLPEDRIPAVSSSQTARSFLLRKDGQAMRRFSFLLLFLLIGSAIVSVPMLAQKPTAQRPATKAQSAESSDRPAARREASPTTYPFKRMADGKQWTTQNLNVNTAQSYCYMDLELNCRRYGRLYTWEAARHGCQSLGDGWRLPSDDEWREMARHYGGLLESSADGAKAAYRALVIGGTSGFNAMLGGSRADGRYDRLEAHGFYWTASDNASASAAFYNFGKGGQSLSRHAQGLKQMAASVRCIRE